MRFNQSTTEHQIIAHKMAKKARVSIANGETPKDEVALKNQQSDDATPKSSKRSASAASNGVLKVDGEATSSNRKVRIATESPAASKLKGSPVRGKRTSSKMHEAAVATEVFGEDGKDDEESKHEPKHKDDTAKPAKGLLKSNNAGKKRKAVDAEIEDDQPEASTSKVTADAESTEETGEIDFLAGFASADEDEDDGQDSSDDDEDVAPVTQAELPKLDKGKEKALKGKTIKVSGRFMCSYGHANVLLAEIATWCHLSGQNTARLP